MCLQGCIFFSNKLSLISVCRHFTLICRSCDESKSGEKKTSNFQKAKIIKKYCNLMQIKKRQKLINSWASVSAQHSASYYKFAP